MVMRSLDELQTGDELIYLLHDPRPQLLKRLSGSMQAARLVLSELPEVENFQLSSLLMRPTESGENS